MSWKKKKSSSNPFAFVRFSQLKEAQQAIKNLHETLIRECMISVTMAEYRRNGGRFGEKWWMF